MHRRQEQQAQDKEEKSNLVSLLAISSAGWGKFPSQDIPVLFNYGHVHYYALESIQNAVNGDDSGDGLGSGFVHDMMDNVNDEHYFFASSRLAVHAK